ncbi:TraK domain-containing protein [Morganella morganii]|uniref:TraK domain-containing protein n=2 Tax=Morganella morganii TaxID=582 RepID=UPI001FFDDB9F|nr:type-F conjugative transfer system secretin TraK [Morganella morganii]
MRKRKNSPPVSMVPRLLLCAGLLFSLPVFSAPVTQPPVRIPVTADSQVKVAFSNTQPNMLLVPGDRIVAVDSASGIFLNDGLKSLTGNASGGVVLMTAQTEPFTFYLRTAGGLTVSVVAVPQKRDGRVLQFISDRPAVSKPAERWERSQAYPETLIALQKGMLNGQLPDGFVSAPVTPLPSLSLPFPLTVQAEKMWNGGQLRIYQITLRNTGVRTAAVPERLFRADGVRAVMIHPFVSVLKPGATAQVWLTVSGENN